MLQTALFVFGSICVVLASGKEIRADQVLDLAPAGSFSIAVIPDTQMYVGSDGKRRASGNELFNPIFSSIVDWILKHQAEQNIVFVSHVGDIVDRNNDDQWKIARACMDRIHGKIPYGISVGNHDMFSSGDSRLFQKYFPKARFEDFDWYGGCYESSPRGEEFSSNNANSYQLFSASGIDFIFLHLECNAPDDVVDWANQVLGNHPDRRALITTHMGWGPLKKPSSNLGYAMDPKGRMQWVKIHGEYGNSPRQLWEKCYSQHRNLLAVFSGDQSRTQCIHAESEGKHGNVVHELLSDYMQSHEDGGWLRLYRFNPSENLVQVFTIHPKKGTLCEGTQLVPDVSSHQFEFTCPLTTTTQATATPAN